MLVKQPPNLRKGQIAMPLYKSPSLSLSSCRAVQQGASCCLQAPEAVNSVRHAGGIGLLTFSPRGLLGTAMGAPTMNLRGALLGKGVMPHRPTTR